MTVDQVDFTERELLASPDYAEPLVVRGVRCHGGFGDDGEYVSPRTLNRSPTCPSTPGPSTTRTWPRPGS